MSRHQDRAAARPLPPGLRICDHCGEARGSTPGGRVAACFCSGVICNRCGERRLGRSPTTTTFARAPGSTSRSSRFWPTPPPRAGRGAARDRLDAPAARPRGGSCPAEADRQALAEMEAWAVLDLVEADRYVGHVQPARPNWRTPALAVPYGCHNGQRGWHRTGARGGMTPADEPPEAAGADRSIKSVREPRLDDGAATGRDGGTVLLPGSMEVTIYQRETDDDPRVCYACGRLRPTPEEGLLDSIKQDSHRNGDHGWCPEEGSGTHPAACTPSW